MVLLCRLLDARRKDYMQNSCQPMEQHLALATVCSRLLHLPLAGLGPCLDSLLIAPLRYCQTLSTAIHPYAVQ